MFYVGESGRTPDKWLLKEGLEESVKISHSPANLPLPAPTVGFLSITHSPPGVVHTALLRTRPALEPENKNSHSPLISKATGPGIKQKKIERRCDLA